MRELRRWRIGRIVVCIFIGGAVASAAHAQSSSYTLFRDGRYDEAIRAATAEIERQPGNVNGHIVLGWAHLSTGRNSEALDAGTNALALSPDDARAVAIVGEAHYNLGNLLDALPYLEQYVELEPRGIAVARAHAIMGDIFVEFTEYNHAEVAYAAAVQFDPQVWLWWQRLGFVREQLGHNTDAVEAYRRAIALNPNSSELRAALSRVSTN